MSTDLTTFKSKAPSAAFAALNPQTESLADGIGQSYGVIHYRGKNWSLRYRGETFNFTRSDDGTPLSYLDVIILRQLPAKSKSYYPKGSFERGEDGPPLCSSLDGITPDPSAKQVQAAACALCPRNEWKTNPEGRKGRECADYKRLAVLITPSLTKQALGTALMEPVFLRIPPASLNALAKMGEDMAAQGWHYSTFVTRIGFVAESPHPQMTFKPVQELTEKEAPIVLPMREDPQSLRITGESELSKPRAPAQIATEPPFDGGVHVRAQTIASEIGDEQAAKVRQAVAPKKTTPPPVTLDLKPNPAPDRVDTGFGDIGEPAPVKAKPALRVVQEEVGEVEEASADLDARIANLLKTD